MPDVATARARCGDRRRRTARRGVDREREPGAAVQSDAAVLADFRARAGSVFHASCTCAMGADPRTRRRRRAPARARGRRLRVVDASIFPNVTSGNSNAPTIMVAERAADLIVQDSRAPPG